MATMITKEVDLGTFQAGIFLSQADLVSPVAIEERDDPYVLQTLPDVFHVMKRHPDQWSTFAGPLGVGHYSLVTGKSMGVLARVDSYFRTPSEEEIREDVQGFGDQVFGPAVSEVPIDEIEKYKNSGVFRYLGEEFYFCGPPRLDKTVILSRVFPGVLPDDISELNKDIEGISEAGEMIVPQGYHLICAENGEMKYQSFKKIEDFDSTKLTDFGKVRMERRKLLYYPAGKSEPIDFTYAVFRQ